MSDAALQFVTALRAHLAADGAVAGFLANQILDAPSRLQRFPSLVIEDIATSDRSGQAATLEEHRVTLRLLTRAGGKKEALSIAAAIAAALDPPPAPSGHLVVLLSIEAVESRLLRDRLTSETILRLKVLTEPV
jgi:hypothetical protein